MDNIKEILEKNIENYDTEYHRLEEYIHKNAETFKDEMKYAGYLMEPIKEKQILFWCKGQKGCADVPRYIFDYWYQIYGKEYTYVWVVKTNKDRPEGLPEEVVFVKKNSSVYWEALACSKYLIGNVMLPGIFCKREEQIYINSMLGIDNFFQRRSYTGADAHSLILKEMLKTDYLLSDSEWMAKEVYEKEYQLTGIYQGKIINTDNLRAAYMKQRGCGRNETGKCMILMREKDNFQWFEERMEQLSGLGMEISLARDQDCILEGKDICDSVAQCDIVVSDRSNYLRDAKRYGCRVCCWGAAGNHLGFENVDIVDTIEGLKKYIAKNVDFRRKDVEIEKDGIKKIVDVLLKGQTEKDAVYHMPAPSKKKLLILTDWTLSQEKKCTIRQCISMIDLEAYDVTVAAPLADNSYDQKEMDDLPKEVRKIVYRGRMVLGKEEYIFYRLIKNNLHLYVGHAAIYDYIKKIIQREWRRIWGGQEIDCVVLFGEKMKQYFLTAASEGAKKVLAAEDFMKNGAWVGLEECQKLLEAFETIYIPAVTSVLEREAYGEKNKDKIKRMPLYFRNDYAPHESIPHVYMGEKEYMAAERWRDGEESEQLNLVQIPVKGSCIVNAEMPLDKNGRAYLETVLAERENIWFFGEYAEEYGNVAGHGAIVMSNFLWKKLYMFPAAKAFFERFDTYYGNRDVKMDAMAEICENFHIKICQADK